MQTTALRTARSALSAAALLLLTACADRVTGPGEGAPPPAPVPLGMVEVTITGIGTPQMSAAARPVHPDADGPRLSLTRPATSGGMGNGSIQLLALATSSMTDGARTSGGYRYFAATFRIRNAQSDGTAYDTERRNLTFVAASTAGTLGGTAFSSVRRFDGSAANPAVATTIVPTGAVHRGAGGEVLSTGADVLQLLTEDEVAAVPLPAGATGLFPYGFVARNAADGSRTLPASPAAGQYDGVVTFALRVPLQATASEDPFSVNMVFLVLDDSQTRVTQSQQEQGAAARAALEARAAEIGATQVTLLPRGGYTGAAATRMLCGVRTAGMSGSPTATAAPCPSIASVAVAPAAPRLAPGGSQALTATVTDVDGYPADWATVSWSNDSAGVLTLAATGPQTATVTGAALGTGTVTASAGGQSGSATVTVAGVAAVEVAPARVNQLVGKTAALTATLRDAGGNVLSPGSIAWTSSDEAVATVDSLGVVTVVAAGTATITATAGGQSGTAELTGIEVLPETVTAGEWHTCALTGAGAAYCWGEGLAGQLGHGTAASSATPVAVSGGHTFTRISAGQTHTVALTSAGAVYAWGRNLYGELGDGTTTQRNAPVPALGGLTFQEISAGYTHTAALTPAGAAYAWGGNDFGQLGDGTTTQRSAPVAVSGGLVFERIAAGGRHTVALTPAGAAFAWGMNSSGQLGDGTTTHRSAPAAVAGGLVFAQVSVGALHAVAVTPAGAAYAWGNGGFGGIGDGDFANRTTPVAVDGGLTFAQVSAGNDHSVGVTRAGVAYAWGNNTNGQLGDGTTTTRGTPVAVSGGLLFAQADAGFYHSVALTPAGAAHAWGNNLAGQLGDGTTTNRITAGAVSGGLTFRIR